MTMMTKSRIGFYPYSKLPPSEAIRYIQRKGLKIRPILVYQMSDLHDEIVPWRKHLAGADHKPVRSPKKDSAMPYLGEFIGE